MGVIALFAVQRSHHALLHLEQEFVQASAGPSSLG